MHILRIFLNAKIHYISLGEKMPLCIFRISCLIRPRCWIICIKRRLSDVNALLGTNFTSVEEIVEQNMIIPATRAMFQLIRKEIAESLGGS